MAPVPMQELGFQTGFAVEIHAMASDEFGKHTAQEGEEIVEYSVLCKEYHKNGDITVHHDEEHPSFAPAMADAEPWADKWNVEIE